MALDVGPSPAYRAACRYVLGGDDPATVIGSIRRGRRTQMRVLGVHAVIVLANSEWAALVMPEVLTRNDQRRDLGFLSQRDRNVAYELAVALRASEGEK